MSTGASILIKGEIVGQEDLTIGGRVEGKIRLEGRVLTLAPGSHVLGEITAGTVILAGKVEGKVTATAPLEVRAAAVVVGDLSSPLLVVAEGAEVCGKVEMPKRERTSPKLAAAS
jgi:cytoskeletal protein CcmA (bactofilin family)